jgi:hypothetical protein
MLYLRRNLLFRKLLDLMLTACREKLLYRPLTITFHIQDSCRRSDWTNESQIQSQRRLRERSLQTGNGTLNMPSQKTLDTLVLVLHTPLGMIWRLHNPVSNMKMMHHYRVHLLMRLREPQVLIPPWVKLSKLHQSRNDVVGLKESRGDRVVGSQWSKSWSQRNHPLGARRRMPYLEAKLKLQQTHRATTKHLCDDATVYPMPR